jgi:hypothetical protein
MCHTVIGGGVSCCDWLAMMSWCVVIGWWVFAGFVSLIKECRLLFFATMRFTAGFNEFVKFEIELCFEVIDFLVVFFCFVYLV